MAKRISKEQNLSRLAIIIPVYNHERQIVSVIREALKLQCLLFVIDDGSTDGTYDRIKNISSIKIIRHNKNRGKGAAILAGFIAAKPLADWAVTIDADGQHHPEDIWQLVRAIPVGTRPIIIGRREGMDHQNVPWKSRFGKMFSNFWVRASGGPDIKDTQSGFRLYPLPEAMNIPVRARRFQFELEILVKAKWQGIAVREAPIRVTYQSVVERVSHYRGFVDFCRNMGTFSRLIFTRLFILPFSQKGGLRYKSYCQ
jgi:glycosyltransferase involved in cell wall biosynthesis